MKKYVYLFSLLFAVTSYAQISWELAGLGAICPSIEVTNETIYAGDTEGNLWGSNNPSAGWSYSMNIGTSHQINDIAVASNGYIFLTTGSDEEGDGVFRSFDNGATWQQCPMTAGLETRDIIIKNNTIFVSTFNSGIGKSTDWGETWSGASNSVPEDNIGAFNITKDGTLIIGVKGSNGVYRSTDNGANWTITNFPQSLRVYSLTVASNNHIFAGTKESYDGVYKSIDDGATWQKITSLPDNIEYSSNGISASDGKIYIGVLNVGVYYSTDFGDTWQLSTQGFQSLLGFALAEGLEGTIYATTGAGVYKSTGTTDVNSESFTLNNFQLEQNYPNPFNPSTVISYNLPNQQRVSLKVYDVLGNQVAALVNEDQQAGSHSISFNAGQLSSGIYFYRLNAGSFSETRSMILIK